MWRGSGLFTELVAVHFLLPTLGLLARGVDRDRGRAVAALGVALTGLSHVIFGYVVGISGVVLAWFGPKGMRGRRLARLAVIFLLAVPLVAWFLLPLVQSSASVNHSR